MPGSLLHVLLYQSAPDAENDGQQRLEVPVGAEAKKAGARNEGRRVPGCGVGGGVTREWVVPL